GGPGFGGQSPGAGLEGKMDLAEAVRFLREPFIYLCVCLCLDVLIGDPPYAWHPVRFMGRLMERTESALRGMGLDGRFGGFLLFLVLAAVCGCGAWAVHAGLERLGRLAGGPVLGAAFAFAWEVYLGYSLLALGALVSHGKRIAAATAAGDLPAARAAAGMLVGRDTDTMDSDACNRAAV